MTTLRQAWATLVVVAACGPSRPPAPVELQERSRGGEVILAVVPNQGLRLNARVPPAVELASGDVLRLARGRISKDSSYFLEPPWEVRPEGVAIRGTLRVSYCPPDEPVCRSMTIPVDLSE
jgi:hypothetical protein